MCIILPFIGAFSGCHKPSGGSIKFTEYRIRTQFGIDFNGVFFSWINVGPIGTFNGCNIGKIETIPEG